MIRVDREAEPRGLRENGAAWGQELCDARFAYYQELATYTSGEASLKPKKPDAVKGRYASQGVKNTLARMFAGKCCYCESKAEAVSYLNVEHFRPQSVYPKLAYCWTNLLYACVRCNGSHKSDRFPLAPDGETAREAQDAPCRRGDTDDGLIIDPCREDPAEYFSYRFIGQGVNVPVDVVLVCLNRRAETSRDVYGLDREDLSDARREHLQHIRSAVLGYQVAKAYEVQDKIDFFRSRLRQYIQPRSAYSAMARVYIMQECGADF